MLNHWNLRKICVVLSTLICTPPSSSARIDIAGHVGWSWLSRRGGKEISWCYRCSMSFPPPLPRTPEAIRTREIEYPKKKKKEVHNSQDVLLLMQDSRLRCFSYTTSV